MFCRLRRSAVWGFVCVATLVSSGKLALAEEGPLSPASAGPQTPVVADAIATPPASAPASAAGPASAAPPASAPGKLGFDLFQDEPAPVLVAPDPELQLQIERRRSMLETHQILGLTTLGVMAATCVLGQLDYNDMYGSGRAGTGN